MAKQLLYQASSLYDGDEPANLEPGGGRPSDTWQLPVECLDFAPWEPLGEFDLHSGQITVDGQAWFDCGEMPVHFVRKEVWPEYGVVGAPDVWMSIGARYGELRVNMKRFGQLEVRPARHGSVRVAPSQ